VYHYPPRNAEIAENSLNKYMKRCDRPDMDVVVAKHCINLVEQLTLLQLGGKRNRVMTLDEVIELMDGRKSNGWPFDIKYPTKEKFLASEERIEVEKFWEALADYAPLLDMETIFLKKEPRPKEKGARCVFSLGVRKTMCENRLIKMLTENLKASWQNLLYDEGWMAFGMPASHGTWDRLARKFDGWSCFELDGSAWDASMFPWLIEQFASIHIRLMDKLSKDDEQRIRHVYTTAYHVADILPGGNVVLRFSGNGSGHPGTTLWNMWFAIFSTLYGHHRQSPGVLFPLQYYAGRLSCIVFGDDNIVCLNPDKPIKFDIGDFRKINWFELYCQYTASNSCALTDLRFFNFGWVLRCLRGIRIWAPDPDVKKILYSLAFPVEPLSKRTCLERAISIRQTTFNNPGLFNWVDAFVSWLESQLPGMNPKVHTSPELEDLYFGWETPTAMPLYFGGDPDVELQSYSGFAAVKLPPRGGLNCVMSKPPFKRIDDYIDAYYKKKEYLEHPLGAVGRKVSDAFYEGVLRPYGKIVDYFREPTKEGRISKNMPGRNGKTGKGRAGKPGKGASSRSRNRPAGKTNNKPTRSLGGRAGSRRMVGRGMSKNKSKSIPIFKNKRAIAAAYPMQERPTSFRIVKGLPGGGLKVSGSDFITTLPETAFTPGELVYSLDVNPSVLGQRLAVFAELYEMFWCTKLNIMYEPASSVQNEGSMIGFFEIDVKDTLPAGISAIRFAENHAGASYTNIYMPHVWSKPFQQKRTDMYIERQGSDVRIVNQGRFNLLAQVGIDAAKLKGSLRIDWEFDLYGPQLRPGTGGMYLRVQDTASASTVLSALGWDLTNLATWWNTGTLLVDDTGGAIINYGIETVTATSDTFYIEVILPPGKWFLRYQQKHNLDVLGKGTNPNAGTIITSWIAPTTSACTLVNPNGFTYGSDSTATNIVSTYVINPSSDAQKVHYRVTYTGTVVALNFSVPTSTFFNDLAIISIPQVPNDGNIDSFNRVSPKPNHLELLRGEMRRFLADEEMAQKLLDEMKRSGERRSFDSESKEEKKNKSIKKVIEPRSDDDEIVEITPKKIPSLKGTSTSSSADALRKS